MSHVGIVDWGDDAYREHGCSQVLAEFTTKQIPSISYDGGRVDIDGYPDTIWVMGHQWSVNITEV